MNELKRYRAVFQGRKVGAIGIMHTCVVIVSGATKEQARFNIYRTHDHIMHLRLTPITDTTTD